MIVSHWFPSEHRLPLRNLETVPAAAGRVASRLGSTAS